MSLPLNLERHPLSAAWPEWQSTDFKELVASIKEFGVEEPVKVYEGKILDGWHRYTAWLEAVQTNPAAKCPSEEFAGTLEEAAGFVKRRHMRRNITKEAEAQALVRGDEYVRSRAPELAKSAQQLAEEGGMSVRTIERARVIERKAIPKVKDALDAGEIKTREAEKIARLPADQQEQAVAAPRAPVARQATPQRTEGGAWRAAEPTLKPVRPVIGASVEALDELRERNAVLVEEFDRVNDELTAFKQAHGDEGQQAEAHAEIKELRKELNNALHRVEVLTDARDAAIAEANELRKQCGSYRSQLQKLRAA